jgi:hypothetical protein
VDKIVDKIRYAKWGDNDESKKENIIITWYGKVQPPPYLYTCWMF